jgi:putative oxidoreductase
MEARASISISALLLRLLLGSLFIAHLHWKFAVFPGGLEAWWGNLLRQGYPAFVPAYVLSAEIAGALLLAPGVLTRYVAIYAAPMMIGAAQFWLVRKGFYFTQAGAELPLVWLALLGLQAVAGDAAGRGGFVIRRALIAGLAAAPLAWPAFPQSPFKVLFDGRSFKVWTRVGAACKPAEPPPTRPWPARWAGGRG